MARRSAWTSVGVRSLPCLLVALIICLISACQPAATAPITVTPSPRPAATATPTPLLTATSTLLPPSLTPIPFTPSPSPTIIPASPTPSPTASLIPATATATDTPTPAPTLTPTPTLSPQAALAREMFMAINAERAKSDLVTPAFTRGTPPSQPQPLQVDERLAQVAEAHARDMATRSYFSHTTPEGKTPQDRIREAQISFDIANENIYMTQGDDPVGIAMTWFMQDQSHRDAILDPRYNRVGVGVHIEGKMIYFVQKFMAAP